MDKVLKQVPNSKDYEKYKALFLKIVKSKISLAKRSVKEKVRKHKEDN